MRARRSAGGGLAGDEKGLSSEASRSRPRIFGRPAALQSDSPRKRREGTGLMGTPLAVLFVEDSPDDAELALRALAGGGYDVTHERVDTAAAMTAALDRRAWDVIVSDYSMPSFN